VARLPIGALAVVRPDAGNRCVTYKVYELTALFRSIVINGLKNGRLTGNGLEARKALLVQQSPSPDLHS